MATYGPAAIAASGDDGYYGFSGITTFGSGDAVVFVQGNNLGTRFAGFFRFDGVSIPAGSTINSATLRVTPVSISHDTAACAIYANDADDAVAPTDGTTGAALTLTTANVAWSGSNLGTSEVSSPDITSVIQEVIDRGGWASGQAIMLVLVENDSNNVTFRPESFDSSAGIANIEIDYTEGGGGSSVAVFQALRMNGTI